MKRFLSAVFTLLVSIGLFGLSAPVQVVMAAAITVDGGGGGDYLTVQDAVDNATAGDTILIMPGTYNEWVTVDKALTITGEDRDTTILQGSVASALNGIDIQGADGVSISSLTLMEYRCGIRVTDADNTSITNTRIMDNLGSLITDYCGIETQNSDYGSFTGNILSNNEFGIFLRNGSDYNTVSGNVITDNGYGIRLNSSTNNTLSGNTVSSTLAGSTGIFVEYGSDLNEISGNNSSNNVAHGLEITGSNLNAVSGNTFNNNGLQGVFLLINASINEITGNEISGNGANGVFVNTNCATNTISGNTISNNGDRGIYLYQNVTLTEIYNNTISNNPLGLRLFAAHTTTVYNNSFIDNTTQASEFSSGSPVFSLPAPIGGNYWSNWNTPDVDLDGFVDSPYIWSFPYQDDLPWALQDGWVQEDTPESLLETIDELLGDGSINNEGIANSLTVKLDAAIKMIEQGNIKTAVNILNALINEINAQAGKHITLEAVEALLEDIEAILAGLEEELETVSMGASIKTDKPDKLPKADKSNNGKAIGRYT